jgi:uncharacterized membrane protein (Fun14 family)
MMMVMNTYTLASISASIGGGFFGGLLIGYALRKVIKMIAIVFGLFLAGLAFLQYQQIATIHWHKLEGAITKLATPKSLSSFLAEEVNNRHSLFLLKKNI